MILQIVKMIVYLSTICVIVYYYKHFGLESAAVLCFWYMVGYMFAERVEYLLSAIYDWRVKELESL